MPLVKLFPNLQKNTIKENKILRYILLKGIPFFIGGLIMKVVHKIEPIFTPSSKILILGTMPSPKSRENKIYYGHPKNRFWTVLSSILKENLPNTNLEKIELLKKYNIALWDVLHSCDIEGASDNSIKNPVPNDIKSIVDKSEIKHIFTTGKKALELYNKLCLENVGIEAISLPSTSPANFRYSEEKLIDEYSIILKYLK